MRESRDKFDSSSVLRRTRQSKGSLEHVVEGCGCPVQLHSLALASVRMLMAWRRFCGG